MKFSEIPRFLLIDFFRKFYDDLHHVGSGALIGGPHHMANDQNALDQYAHFFAVVEVTNTDGDQQRVEIPFRPKNEGGSYTNNFFYLERMRSVETSATSAIEIEPESNFYVLRRKGHAVESYFTTLIEYGGVGLEAPYSNSLPMNFFVNVNKRHLYLGRLYPETTTDQYRLEYWGMDRYALSCLPQHNQTAGVQQLLTTYFDQTYNSIYNMARGINTLIDAKEIDLDYITYLARTYDINLDKSYLDSLFIDRLSPATKARDQKLREYTSNIVNLLKRKGSYSSLYVVFKNIFWASQDQLNVYERWQDPNSLATLSSSAAWPYNLEDYFVDFNYLYYYNATTEELAGCLGSEYYKTISAGGYPIPLSHCYIHRQLTPNNIWKVPHGLGLNLPIVQVFDSDLRLSIPTSIEIKSEALIEISFDTLVKGVALVIRPEVVSPLLAPGTSWVFQHNLNTLAPIIDGIYTYTTTISAEYPFASVERLDSNSSLVFREAGTLSNAETIYTLAVQGDYFHEQDTAASVWNIDHNLDSRAVLANFYTGVADSTWNCCHSLGTSALIVAPYDNDNFMIKDYSVTYSDSNNVTVTFPTSASGRLLIKIADETLTLASSASWTLSRSLSGYALVSQVYSSNVLVSPNGLTEKPLTNYSTSLESSATIAGKYLYAVPDYVELVMYPTNTWTITHNLSAASVISDVYLAINDSPQVFVNSFGHTDLAVQVFTSVSVAPSAITITSDTITIPVPGGFITVLDNTDPAIGHYIHIQSTPASAWWIEHNLDTFALLFTCYTSAGVEFTPEEVLQYDKKWTKITCASVINGSVGIQLANALLIGVKKVIPESIEINDLNNITVELSGASIGYVACSRVDAVSTQVVKATPTEYRVIDENSSQATFGAPFVGIGALREIGQLTYAENLFQSPHYKAEIDLNCQPLCFESNDIITRESANSLYNSLETCRPACKYAHYYLNISPSATFTTDRTPLYNNILYDVDLYTYCTVDVAEESTPGAYMFSSYYAQAEWYIIHTLGTEDVLIQCYNYDGYQVLPYSVEVIDLNTVRVRFAIPTAGFCLLLSASEVFMYTAAASSTWDMTTAEASASLSDYYLRDNTQVYPSNVNINIIDNVTSTWYVPTLGECRIRDFEYLHVQSRPSSNWIINHNLPHRGVFVQVFDIDHNQLFPSEIKLHKNQNRVEITLVDGRGGTRGPTEFRGYVLLTAVDGFYSKQTLINAIADGGYVKIGTSPAPAMFDAEVHNDLEVPYNSVKYPVKTVTEDATHYYVLVDCKCLGESLSITEMGLFTGQDELAFYSYMLGGQFYKHESFNVTTFYRIKK